MTLKLGHVVATMASSAQLCTLLITKSYPDLVEAVRAEMLVNLQEMFELYRRQLHILLLQGRLRKKSRTISK